MKNVLTEEGQALADEFEEMYADGCCSCHINPPCGWCVHPGNPHNLAEMPDAWIYDPEEDPNG